MTNNYRPNSQNAKTIAESEILLLTVSMNFGEGPLTHLCARCEARQSNGKTKFASHALKEIAGVNILDGDLDPDTITIDFKNIEPEIESILISVHPFHQPMNTFGHLELNAKISSESFFYGSVYNHLDNDFVNLDWIELRRTEKGLWELVALAGIET